MGRYGTLQIIVILSYIGPRTPYTTLLICPGPLEPPQCPQVITLPILAHAAEGEYSVASLSKRSVHWLCAGMP